MGRNDKLVSDRYAGWKTPDAQAMLDGMLSLDQIATATEQKGIDLKPRSGKQEQFEDLINRVIS